VGGIGPARRLAEVAAARGVTYVNHTFTSHLALSASIQPYAGLADHTICEYPAAPKALAVELTRNHLSPGADGLVRLPDSPGLGMEIDPQAVRRYQVDVEIRVGGRTVHAAPAW
jgi:L-alanine-DL-glutamate epimerase-like enolase superfamily enzyme